MEKKDKDQKPSPRERSELMFSFDDQSPQTTPRKESCETSENSSACLGTSQHSTNGGAMMQESPSSSPRSKTELSPNGFLTQSSPPRFVSFDEIMKAADGVLNMSLAHEIAVNNDFRFQKTDPPPDSLAKKVHDIVHKAFWDVLEEKLNEDPPDYSHALILLEEVKQNVKDLILPHHQHFHAEVEEVLDMKLIEQQAEHGALDIQYYAGFVIHIMAKLCCPMRDEDIEQLRQIKEVVPLFKAIFATLDLMKLDMANFTIQQIRPYLQSHSIKYEKAKFDELLKQQKENNQDGLLFTKAWLHRAGEIVCKEAKARCNTKSSTDSMHSASTDVKQSSKMLNEPSEGCSAKSHERQIVSPPGVSPAAILNTAYMELLQWSDEYGFPETLLLDQNRFLDLGEKVKWLGLMSSVLMVTYNTVGSPISGVRALKEKLKNDVAVIISGVKFEEVSSVMPNVSTHVIKEVQLFLESHGHKPLTDETVTCLKGLIESVASPSQAVHKCLRERLLAHIQQLLFSPGSQQIQVPGGFAAMAEEFSHVYGQFLRLITHNRAVFGFYYANIIADFLKKKAEQECLDKK